MIKSIIALVLLIVSVFFNIRHGWGSLNLEKNPESAKMIADLGMKSSYAPVFGIVILLIAVLLVIPKTFVLGNILNSMSIVIIMGLALNSGNTKIALAEIPFLLMPLVLIWLKYPFKG